jgi:SAM-dependent methyltransferase
MSDPYAAVVADCYDAEFDHADADIAGYARRALPGPVLVLGCGTGRVCRGLAGTRTIVGLDRSPDMLAHARAHPRAGDTRSVEGDVADFALGRFREVLLPNGVFNFLPDRRRQLACLTAVRAALTEDGIATFDLVMPDFELLAVPHTPETPAWSGHVRGVPVVRTREVFRDPVAATLRLVDRFYASDRCLGMTELSLRLVFPNELEWMLEGAGLYTDERFGDHRGGPLRTGCDRLLVRAGRA